MLARCKNKECPICPTTPAQDFTNADGEELDLYQELAVMKMADERIMKHETYFGVVPRRHVTSECGSESCRQYLTAKANLAPACTF